MTRITSITRFVLQSVQYSISREDALLNDALYTQI